MSILKLSRRTLEERFFLLVLFCGNQTFKNYLKIGNVIFLINSPEVNSVVILSELYYIDLFPHVAFFWAVSSEKLYLSGPIIKLTTPGLGLGIVENLS